MNLVFLAKDAEDNVITDYEIEYFNNNNELISINDIEEYGIYYASYTVEADDNVRKIIRTILVDYC